MSKKQPKLTPWFPGDVKPVRKGVYERNSISGAYAYWDGAAWCCGFNQFFELEDARDSRSSWQADPWRGLAVKP